MHFVSAAKILAGARTRPAHFASNPDTEGHPNPHHADCDAHTRAWEAGHPKLTLRQAIKQNRKIIITLGMGVGIPVRDAFRNAASQRGRKVSPNFKSSEYITLPASSTEMILRNIQKIQDLGGQEALDRTYVNYKGRMDMPLKDFIVGGDTDRQKKILEELYFGAVYPQSDYSKAVLEKETGRPGARRAAGFPRLFLFNPKDATDLADTWQTGEGKDYPRIGNLGYTFYQKVYPGHAVAPRSLSNDGKGVFMVAAPYVNYDELHKTREELKDLFNTYGTKVHRAYPLFLRTRVYDPAQIAPVGGQ